MTNILMGKKLTDEQKKHLEDKYNVSIYFMQDGKFPESGLLDKIEIYAGWDMKDSVDIMPNLKWVHLYSAGVDRQLERLSRMAAPPRLTNNRGTYGVPLSEHSLALLFAVNRRIGQYTKNQTEHKWNYKGGVKEIYGSTVGIVGFGDVGQYTAKMMKAMNAKVLAHKLHKSPKPEYVDEMYYGNEGLDVMLPKCDFVLLSLPGTEETKHLFNLERMKKMKKGAVIVNVGRGYVIDCDALADLIEEGHLLGAGLDVTDPEPLPGDHRLWDMDNVVITPHMAGSSPNFTARMYEIFKENLESYMAGEKMPNEIDLDKGY